MKHSLHIKIIWGLYHKQQRKKDLDEFKKVMKEPLHHLFDDHKFCGACRKENDYLPTNWIKITEKEVL